mmetsp:Transcript_12330/g.26360  ORF Transcript_12330/g.26360 Transcript_12330/m.26360 type:complete len:604 (-) Transcript_12330:232-2043(-)
MQMQQQPDNSSGGLHSHARSADNGSSSAIAVVMSSTDILNTILHKLPLRDRCTARRTCRLFNIAYWHATNWQAVHLEASCYTDDALACIPQAVVLSLRLRGSCLQFTTLVVPSLTEMDISHCRVRPDVLAAAFQSCGKSLLRLNISGLQLLGGVSGWMSYSALVAGSLPKNLLWIQLERLFSLQQTHGPNAELADDGPLTDSAIGLLAPLRRLKVLVARGADVPAKDFTQLLQRVWVEAKAANLVPAISANDAIPTEVIPRMWTLRAVSLYCPDIEELHVGWLSEVVPSTLPMATPSAMPRFSEWCLAVPRDAKRLGARCRHLNSISFSGCVLLTDDHLLEIAAGPLIALDVCGCRRLTDEGLATFLQKSANTLVHLNLRGTLFGEKAVSAICAAATRPLKLTKLNLSCTEVTGEALRKLTSACASLSVLDVCYAPALRADDALACASEHYELQRVGIGGLPGLTLDALDSLLLSCPHIEHLGIGGCDVRGGAALGIIARRTPGLTALNAHKLPGIDRESVFRLCVLCPKLTMLDLNGCNIDDSVAGILSKLLHDKESEFFPPADVLQIKAPQEQVSRRDIRTPPTNFPRPSPGLPIAFEMID